MSKKLKISVAMATFNGAKHLSEQLESLAKQDLLPHELVISDDGSSDSTIEIANEFACTAPFPVKIYKNGKQLGYADNFLLAASKCSGDWIAFCDQDDVWLPTKVSTVVTHLTRDPAATLFAHTASVVDENLSPQNKVVPEINETRVLEPGTMPPNQLLLGFCLVFPSFLLKAADASNRPAHPYRPQRKMAHDQYVCFLGSSLGRTVLVKESLALYRRHAGTTSQSGKPDKRMLNFFFRLLPDPGLYDTMSLHFAQCSDVVRCAGRNMGGHTETLAQRTSERCTRLSSIFEKKGMMLKGSFFNRLKTFWEVYRMGAYTGSKKETGLTGLVKDLTTVLMGAGLIFAVRHRLERALE